MFFEILGIWVLISLLICVIFLLILIVILSCQRAQLGEIDFLGNMKLNLKKLHAETKKKMTDPLPLTKNSATSMKPGMLISRQDSKQMILSPKNAKIREKKRKMRESEMLKTSDSDAEKEASELSEYCSSTSSSVEDHKAIKGVTFSQEVIVVDIGKGKDEPQYYTRGHKDKK